jgi:hypothetical protein
LIDEREIQEAENERNMEKYGGGKEKMSGKWEKTT